MDWLENIKKLKKEKGLTNEALSERCGISVGTLNKLLAGATVDPKLSTLILLANGLDANIDEMLYGKSSGGASLSPDEEELVSKYRALDVNGRETANYIINKEY